jgi:hypothetical protein
MTAAWHNFEDTHKVYISSDEGVVEVRRIDGGEVAEELADLVAWAVGVGQHIGLGEARDGLLRAFTHAADDTKLYASYALLQEWQRRLYPQREADQ